MIAVINKRWLFLMATPDQDKKLRFDLHFDVTIENIGRPAAKKPGLMMSYSMGATSAPAGLLYRL